MTSPMVFLSDKIPQYCKPITEVLKKHVLNENTDLRVKHFVAKNGNEVTKYTLPRNNHSLLVVLDPNQDSLSILIKRSGRQSSTLPIVEYETGMNNPNLDVALLDFMEVFVSKAFNQRKDVEK